MLLLPFVTYVLSQQLHDSGVRTIRFSMSHDSFVLVWYPDISVTKK